MSLQIKCNLCHCAHETTFKELQKQVTDVSGMSASTAAAVILEAPIDSHVCINCVTAIRATLRAKHRLPGG